MPVLSRASNELFLGLERKSSGCLGTKLCKAKLRIHLVPPSGYLKLKHSYKLQFEKGSLLKENLEASRGKGRIFLANSYSAYEYVFY